MGHAVSQQAEGQTDPMRVARTSGLPKHDAMIDDDALEPSL